MRNLNIKIVFLLVVLLSCLVESLTAQQVNITLKGGKQIKGGMISCGENEVKVDPEGAVSFLVLKAENIESVELIKTGRTIYFPISKDQILLDFSKVNQRINPVNNSSYYKHYYDFYFFGGFSSQTTVGNFDINYDGLHASFPIIYKNGGLGGIGMEYLYDSPNKSLDYIFDLEVGFLGAKMLTEFEGEELELLSGLSMAMDFDLNLYPFQARNFKFPSPFVFVGLGFRMITMESAEEIHGAIPFGLGFRMQVTNGFAVQIKERFVYSNLEGVDGFILPETRLELHFTMNKW